LGIIVALDIMLGWKVFKAVGKIWRFLSNFSAQNLLINSHQAHQIAAHPCHHLPMGLPDDNPSSFGHASVIDIYHCHRRYQEDRLDHNKGPGLLMFDKAVESLIDGGLLELSDSNDVYDLLNATIGLIQDAGWVILDDVHPAIWLHVLYGIMQSLFLIFQHTKMSKLSVKTLQILCKS
jgi:hypothetical protein